MTFLAPSSDRTVRAAVDAHLQGAPAAAQPAQATFETRNSRYVLSSGSLTAALDETLIGAEFVGWLIESESYATVVPVWQEGARAILVDARRTRQIVVTSTTRSFRVDQPDQPSGSPRFHPGSPVGHVMKSGSIPPCPPPPPRLAGMAGALPSFGRPLVTVGSPEPSPPIQRIPALRPSTPPVAMAPEALLEREREPEPEPQQEPPPSIRPSSAPPPSSPPRSIPSPPPSLRRISAPPRPLPYPSPPPRRASASPLPAPPPPGLPPPSTRRRERDLEEGQITAPQVAMPSFELAPPEVSESAPTAAKTTSDGVPLVEITLEEDLAADSLGDEADEDESTDDDGSDRKVTGKHSASRKRRVPPPPGPLASGGSSIPPAPPTDPYGTIAPR